MLKREEAIILCMQSCFKYVIWNLQI